MANSDKATMPEHLLNNSYSQYKQDTNYIVHWLVTTALKCGYPADELDVQALKVDGKKQKPKNPKGDSSKDPQIVKYVVPITKYVPLAQHIISSSTPTADVPPTMVSTLERTINIGKRHQSWWKKSRLAEASEQYTNNVKDHTLLFEEVKDILEPLIKSSKKQPAVMTTKDPMLVGGSEIEDDGRLPYLYTKAEMIARLHETVHTDEASMDGKQYLAEWANEPEEATLAAHLLFNDLRDLREYIGELWYDVHGGNLDLVVASLTTNSALTMAADCVEDFQKIFPSYHLPSMMQTFYAHMCELKGEEERNGMNFDMHWATQDTYVPMERILTSIIQDLPEDQTTTLVSPEDFGEYDFEAPDGKPEEALFWANKENITDLISDFFFLCHHSFIERLIADEFTHGMRVMFVHRKITVDFMFATRVFLDIMDIMDDKIGVGVEIMQERGRSINRSIASHLYYHKDLQMLNWPSSYDDALRTLSKVIQEWTLKDLVGNSVNATLKQHGYEPRTGPKYLLLSQHPLLAGLLTYYMQQSVLEAGVRACQIWGAPVSIGHLYNALQQEKLVKKAWKTMDFCFAAQGKARMLGGSIPTFIGDYLRPFCHTTECPAFEDEIFRHGPRGNSAQRHAPVPVFSLNPAPAFQLFRIYRNEHVAWMSQNAQQKLQVVVGLVSDAHLRSIGVLDVQPAKSAKSTKASAGVHAPAPYSSTSTSTTTGHTSTGHNSTSHPEVELHHTSRLSNVEYLDLLHLALSKEVEVFAFDWLLQHRLCWTMLQSVKRACQPVLQRTIGPNWMAAGATLPSTVGYIFAVALKTTDHKHNAVHRNKHRCRVFRVAAAEMERRIGSEDALLAGDLNAQFELLGLARPTAPVPAAAAVAAAVQRAQAEGAGRGH